MNILPQNYYEISDLGLTLPRPEFLGLYLIKIEALCTKNEDFDQTHLNTGSKTQNGYKFTLNRTEINQN